MKIAAWVRPEESFANKSGIPTELQRMQEAGIDKIYLLVWNRDNRVYIGEKSEVGYDVPAEVGRFLSKYGIKGSLWTPVLAGPLDASYSRFKEIEGAIWYVTKEASDIKSRQIGGLSDKYPDFYEIHLDYARSPEKGKEYFEDDINLTGLVTDTVRKIREATRGKRLSAAVFKDNEGKYGTRHEALRINQDWAHWLKHRFLNEAVVMIYTPDMKSFANLVLKSKKIASGYAELRIGIGVNSDRLQREEHRMFTAQEFDMQLAILEANGIEGASILSWGGISGKEDYLKILKEYSGK